jgi:hypothetical protein
MSEHNKSIDRTKVILSTITFILSLITLLISLKLFVNLGIFADEYNSSPVLVDGGTFWLLTDWLRIALLFTLCVFSGIGIVRARK